MQTNKNQKHDAQGINVVKFTIEGKTYESDHQYLTGAQIKQLAEVSAEEELYLSVQEPWKDELVTNDESVNLARPEIEHFYVKRELKYTINGRSFESIKQWIQGHTIRKQAEIPYNEGIFLSVEGPWEDEEVDDSDWVNLARPGEEHFISKKRNITLIVDGTPKDWNKGKITFEEVIILAFGQYIDKPTMVYTVKFEDGPKKNPEGRMFRNSVVFVKDKMIFHATATDKS